MKLGPFTFNFPELAGSTGDWGVLLPLAAGYIVVCGLEPAGFLFVIGLANLLTGLIFRLPLSIEPMKVLAIVAIAQAWSPSMIYSAAFAMGGLWLFFAFSGLMQWVARITPDPVVIGIQVSLGIILIIKAMEMLSSWWILGIICILIILLMRKSKVAPAALVLMIMGGIIIWSTGEFQFSRLSLTVPPLTQFYWQDVWDSLVRAGFAQIPLTAANAVIATSVLIKGYWPQQQVQPRDLALSMGCINLASSFLGGIPLCHGAGGLAGKHYFGARTGGANIMEGIIFILMGLFIASSLADLFLIFPEAIIGAMLFMVGGELIKSVKGTAPDWQLFPLLITVLLSVFMNMAYGFLAGIVVYYSLKRCWNK